MQIFIGSTFTIPANADALAASGLGETVMAAVDPVGLISRVRIDDGFALRVADAGTAASLEAVCDKLQGLAELLRTIIQGGRLPE